MSEVKTEVETDPAAAIEEAIAKRKAARAKEQRKQYATDLEHLDLLEQEHGEGAITALKVDRDNLPTLVILKCPPDPVVKRFRTQTRPVGDKTPDPTQPAEIVADCCLLYPDKDTFARMCGAVPGLHAQAGAAALDLATAKQHDLGKS